MALSSQHTQLKLNLENWEDDEEKAWGEMVKKQTWLFIKSLKR